MINRIAVACLYTSLTFACTNAMADETFSLSNNLKQGALIVGKTEPDSIVKVNDKVLAVSASGDFAFGFGRDEVKPHTVTVTHKSGLVETKVLTPELREYNIQRINGIKQSIMKPNPVAVKRSRQDNAQIKEARKTLSSNTAFANGFIAPIDGTVTGVYGSQRVFNGEKKRPHFGLDYAGKTGDPVKAPADGEVLLWVPDMFYSGGTMIIDHGHGVTSTFLHLSASKVKTGDFVKQGDLVASVGASGRATGPHLDWRINWFDVRLDPAYVLNLTPMK
ncbi:M23 family metallopeptidase [Pseudocolwellia agarivorans]|jgi:murein DD-endopeptidase MepM/ murein hydrolase activator NlpD|uniref:M23 family metallopeptidase n=1 Tax=Pseudocolwellia agarivorans TaxID=1911682 RepID=UPI003F881ED8